MRERLIASRREAVVVLLICLGVLGTGAALLHDRSGDRVDHDITEAIRRVVPVSLMLRALDLTDPSLIVGLSAGAAIVGVLIRRLDVAALAVLVPCVSVALTEYLLKPLVHRTIGTTLVYPSGHETGVASMACVFGLFVLGAVIPLWGKLILLVLLAADVVFAGVGMVGVGFHYASDIVGAFALCVSVTIATALVLDGVAARRLSRRRPCVAGV